ncbi:hypothetical protein Ahy_B03g063402 [Arachis hypogaea]|uniref:Replication protein A 70 kDa DNA-binding subunit B/D first OB fold domain-containing protein n=1 Tax=Arachis hypogaea TaxID=3818 RepID=A0A444ZX85_ARAHY|nr:hypothetical protein Ahy_B03g063402 [Arachis hypogaea]
MVWLDEDGGKIHASVKRVLVSRFVNLLKERISYQIRYFDVGLNEGNFKTTHHEYVINLNQRTDVHRLPEWSSIPRYGFNFVNFDTLNAPGYDYTYLVDVVGYLTGIGSERTLEKDDKSTKFEEPRGNIGAIPNEASFLKIYQGKTIEQLKELDTKGDLSNTPTLLLNLIDKTFLFIVEVQISDNPHFSPSYKVKKMIDNVYLINKSKKAHPIQIDVNYTGGLLPTSKASSIIEGEKVEGAKYFVQNLLLEFSNKVADNDKSEVLKNAITPTKRLSSESEDLKVQGDTSTCKKIKIENET